jgi:integrase
MGKLTALAVKAAKAAGRYGDGDGLFLVVASSGSASWIVRVQKAGRRRDFGLGSAKKVSLAAARQRAATLRVQVEAGLDPIIERRKAEGIPTFREAAAQVFQASQRTWRNPKHQWQWMRTLEMFAFPLIGDVKLNEISAGLIHDVLAEIWLTKPETARRVRQRIGVVLDWGYSKGYRGAEAPMKSVTKGLPRQPRQSGHHAAMPFADVPKFMNRLREKQTWGRLALEAAILTAARSGEIRGATWPEIDLEMGLWTIAAERMKASKPHVVPLSAAAKRVFEVAAQLRTAGNPHVFHGAGSKKLMSDMTLMKVLRDMKLDCTVHGFRSSFRDWVSETTSFPGELAEAALAHAIGNKTEAAYRRGDLLEKRRVLMDAWGAYCDGEEVAVGLLLSLPRAHRTQ